MLRQRIHGTIDGIVMGASAGGVEALSLLLPALPPDLKSSVFVVLHLWREQPSLLVQIFSPMCKLPLREAHDKEPAAPGTIYFAPPDYHLLIDRGPQLSLSVDEPVHFSRPSIDVLFESAAEVFGERLLAIIMSGSNDDGAAGLAAVDRAGGVTIVQDPDTAQVPVMIKSALRQTPSSLVLSLEEIAALLQTL